MTVGLKILWSDPDITNVEEREKQKEESKMNPSLEC